MSSSDVNGTKENKHLNFFSSFEESKKVYRLFSVLFKPSDFISIDF